MENYPENIGKLQIKLKKIKKLTKKMPNLNSLTHACWQRSIPLATGQAQQR